jgi:hypothetical protein
VKTDILQSQIRTALGLYVNLFGVYIIVYKVGVEFFVITQLKMSLCEFSDFFLYFLSKHSFCADK